MSKGLRDLSLHRRDPLPELRHPLVINATAAHDWLERCLLQRPQQGRIFAFPLRQNVEVIGARHGPSCASGVIMAWHGEWDRPFPSGGRPCVDGGSAH